MRTESLGNVEVGDGSGGSQRRGQKVTNETVHQKPGGERKTGRNRPGTKGDRGNQDTLGAEGVLPRG